jgi:flagellar motor protein MotB
LVVQIALSKAIDLARAGRYAQAENLLANLAGGLRDNPSVLDLLARIGAQQGRLSEAESLWQRAIALDPANEAYRAGLRRIAEVHSRHPMWIVRVLPWLVALAVAVGLTLTARSLARDIVARLAELERSVQTLSGGSGAVRPPKLSLAAPGISLRTEGNELVTIFDAGLFYRGIVLRPEARTLLTAFGRELAPHVGSISVSVIGHTNNVPMPMGGAYRDNTALGMARAIAVVEHLRVTAGLPSTVFSVRSLGESQAPYPSDTPENRSRNRTVVIRITSRRG